MPKAQMNAARARVVLFAVVIAGLALGRCSNPRETIRFSYSVHASGSTHVESLQYSTDTSGTIVNAGTVNLPWTSGSFTGNYLATASPTISGVFVGTGPIEGTVSISLTIGGTPQTPVEETFSGSDSVPFSLTE